MRKLKTILTLAIAALLVSGAAICAAAQSRPDGKRPPPGIQEKIKPTPTPSSNKQNARERIDTTANASATIAAADKVRYSYEFTQPEFFIRHILISHDENGRGQISFERKDSDEAITDPVELSPSALARIKTLWDTLRFLDSEANYQSERQFPHMGTMKLGMEHGERVRVAEFNWTNDKDASALVNEYRRIADQAIFVFNITLARENQPLEAPKLMDELGKLYKRNGLSDPQQLVPLLRDLSNDERIPLIARNQAGRLLKQIEK